MATTPQSTPPIIASYGTWKSPLTTDIITEKTITIAEVIVDAATGDIYHVEDRPHEEGRRVLVHSKTSRDVFGENWNARSRVQEYGGSAATVYKDTAIFTDWTTLRVYTISRKDGGWDDPEPVTPENQNYRFGDFNIHPTHPHLVVCILEDHPKPAPADVVNTLVLLNTITQTFTTLASGADFYAFGRFSPDGTKFAWIQWWHPDMPWEGSELYIATLSSDAGSLFISGSPTRVAGSRAIESVTQPTWAGSNKLVFLSDKSGFYNHYIYKLSSNTVSLALGKPLEQDFAFPTSALGSSNYAVFDEDTIIAPGRVDGTNGVLVINAGTQTYTFHPWMYATTSQVRGIPGCAGAVFVGTGDESPATLVSLDLSSGQPRYEVLKSTSCALTLPSLQGFAFSKPQPMTFDIQSVIGSNEPLHVIFYPPTNKDYAGCHHEKPPCIINAHGGPTMRAAPGLNWLVQYWTSRGWAWVDVDYGGSSGYGRAYRDRLKGNWGIVDVEDCITATIELGKAGIVDPKRIVMRGESAGGFTTLATLVKASKVFAAGTSIYGISDLQALAAETHKFESHYCRKLVGGSFAEVPEVYKSRSPVEHAEAIMVPLLILQGDLDAVVPPNQAELMQGKIESHGGKVKSQIFPGEGHGWRKAETVKKAVQLETEWYGEVLGLMSNHERTEDHV